jgi:hypothetical protein
VPGPEAAKTIARMARSMLGGRLDAAGARSLADGTYLLPGRDHLCLVTIDARGSGGACQATEEAIKRGLSSTSPGRFVHVVVPDGVAALRARLRGGRTLRVAVRGNLARLPAAAYAWRFAP